MKSNTFWVSKSRQEARLNYIELIKCIPVFFIPLSQRCTTSCTVQLALDDDDELIIVIIKITIIDQLYIYGDVHGTWLCVILPIRC